MNKILKLNAFSNSELSKLHSIETNDLERKLSLTKIIPLARGNTKINKKKNPECLQEYVIST